MWIKVYPGVVTYVATFSWWRTHCRDTDAHRMVFTVTNFTEPLVVEKLVASMNDIATPSFLPKDGHYMSLSHSVFYFGFACGGGPEYHKGYPKYYFDQTVSHARTLYVPYNESVIHL
ncbi:hypothetical protein MRX96_055780 [Rhipicephalus microplus]